MSLQSPMTYEDLFALAVVVAVAELGVIIFLLYKLPQEASYQSFLMGDDDEPDDDDESERWKRGD